MDPQGKTLAHALLAMEVKAPLALVEAARRGDAADGKMAPSRKAPAKVNAPKKAAPKRPAKRRR
jgi:hypothetical protein